MTDRKTVVPTKGFCTVPKLSVMERKGTTYGLIAPFVCETRIILSKTK